MAIISRIGRRSLKVRLLIGAIYMGLTLGAVTMIYPFILMVAGSTKSSVDSPDSHVVPPYLTDTEELYKKYVEALFNESFDAMKMAYKHCSADSFRKLEVPRVVNPKPAKAWTEFCETAQLPFYTYMIGEIATPTSRGVLARNLRAFKQSMIAHTDGDIDVLNAEMGAEFVNWNAFYFQPEDYLLRRNKPGARKLDEAFRRFKANVPIGQRYYFSPEGFYVRSFLQSKYGRDIGGYNTAHGTMYRSWAEVHLDRTVPIGDGRTQLERDDWELFVRSILNLLWIRADPEAKPLYQEFLVAKYGSLNSINRIYNTEYVSLDDIPLVEEASGTGLVQSDWSAWLEGWKATDTSTIHRIPASLLRVHSVDFMFRDYLRERHDSIPAVNVALGTEYPTWLAILPPQREAHYLAFACRTGALRKEFTVRNFITVIDYVVLHGRGIINTIIYCGLAVLAALIVNPIAAYALSRYKPPSAYKILLFLMLTMAFPPMVTQIPAFLMLREFGMLNSFWALILPGLANGYMIFLLKGFFDSLPQELYESAELDGAGEIRIFWQITMALSKPILAVIALNTFTAAYSNFMMALLICQNEEMWTLMPWLYQLQQRSGEGVIFASLLIAAIPTFLIFVLCQKVIMRGIVVPVEK